ncbi:low molecular weight phosphotyrosine protein phosphatase [Corynebacterium argentoratense]|nr:low molecular weight phosphotyrosine protein phosphatase [Corynebacterium argentoratense]
MADVMFSDAIEDAGLSNDVLVKSCGIGGWHIGDPADRRAVASLAAAGHDGSNHRAAQFGPEHADATLFVAMAEGHVRELQALGVDRHKIHLLRSFDPDSPAGAIVADPYYGDDARFDRTRAEIAASIPGLITWVREHLTSSSDR